jgi:DNA modification methylase
MKFEEYMSSHLLIGDCLETLKTLPDNSIDSIVTDPPYGINFMGKAWDNAEIMAKAVNGVDHNKTRERSASMHAGLYDHSITGNKAFEEWTRLWASEVIRVLKPGGHLLCFSSARTYHRMAAGIENAGFEIRDQIIWMYGTGFPKSFNISKAIDKAAKAERKVIGTNPNVVRASKIKGGSDFGGFTKADATVTAPATKEGKQWEGWGTGLKPAHEPIVLARKPLNGTIANNVLNYGTGGLNIDACRIDFVSVADKASATPQGKVTSNKMAGNVPDVDNAGRIEVKRPDNSKGRWPANVIHDGSEEVISLFSENGEAARFFYCAKPSKKERNIGLDDYQEKIESDRIDTSKVGSNSPLNRSSVAKQNFHPTVKPINLMSHLIKLITPPKGKVLDPFLGSGTTAVAAILEGFDWVGCEMTDDYIPIINGRIKWALKQKKTPK